jgi:hypothetical protein
MAPHVALTVSVQSAAQASDAATIAATSVADCAIPLQGAGKVIAAKPTASEAGAIAFVTGKCAAGKRGTTEDKGNCKNNHGLIQHGDLFLEMHSASAAISRTVSIGYPMGASG